MSHAEEMAKQLLLEAKKKQSPKGFFLSLFGYNKTRIEDVIDCYQRAGNLFKLAKNWHQAASAFKTAADMNMEENNRYEAATCFVLASKCYEKYDQAGAVHSLLSAIQIYTDIGRFVMAAKLHQTIAEMCEQNMDIEKAVQHYEQAADYFKVEENHWSAKKCLLKVADFCASHLNDYSKAVVIYQDMAFADLKQNMLQYAVRENFFKASLCQLCMDTVSAKYSMEFYVKHYSAFEISREYKLLTKIIEHMEEGDADGFTKTVQEYDDMSHLDTWHTKILLRIKQQIKEQPDLL